MVLPPSLHPLTPSLPAVWVALSEEAMPWLRYPPMVLTDPTPSPHHSSQFLEDNLILPSLLETFSALKFN